MLASVMKLVSSGVVFLGGAMGIFGLIQLGLALRDTSSGGGSQIAGAIAMIVGGAVIIAAGALFNTLQAPA